MDQSYFSYFTCTPAKTNDAAATLFQLFRTLPNSVASRCHHRLAGRGTNKVSLVENTLKHALSTEWKQPLRQRVRANCLGLASEYRLADSTAARPPLFHQGDDGLHQGGDGSGQSVPGAG
jgi:hypothetical protein